MNIEEVYNKVENFLIQFDNISLPRGGMTLDDLNELYALIIKNHYKTNHNTDKIRIADVGCWTGLSSIFFGSIAKENNGKCWSIDWFKGSENSNLDFYGKYMDIRKINEDNIKRFELDNHLTIVNKTSVDATKDFVDNFFDVVFIDADHRYEYIKEDINIWLPKVKDVGIICGHDCEFIYRNGMQDLFEHYKNHDMVEVLHLGVIRAVSELANTKKTETGSIWYRAKWQKN